MDRERMTADDIAEHQMTATERIIRAETAREATARAARWADDALADQGVPIELRSLPPRLRYPRWGWRRAIREAVTRQMLTPRHAVHGARLVSHRLRAGLRQQQIDIHGMAFIGRRVELTARRANGRLVVGPWTWIGDGSALRSHEGQVTVGAKVVFGRANVVNGYLDIEVGDESLLADWIYVCDFDHRFDRWDLPIRKQGIAVTPTRIGADVWVGEKASILRGADIGDGSVVASHAVVRDRVPPFSIVAGVPARVIRSRLPAGMDPAEATDFIRRGRVLPGDPLGE